MSQWSEALIQRTIKEWQPNADKTTGEKLTREDAIEILNNVTELFDILYEMYKEDKERASQVTKAPL